jgi:NAD(P)-dependent dehydrogenase (short-subunit alcohol dehydrogenase family)
MKINGVAAVITGGASGLGAATARELAKAGAKVAIFDRTEELGEQVAKELGGVFCKADVTSEEQINAAFEKARAAHGQERILVNCAGTGIAQRTVSKGREHPMSSFELIIRINLLGTFMCITKAAAGMSSLEPVDADGQRGVVINTASVAAFDGQIGQAAYSASKGGVVGMTLPIARDLAQIGVRCCTIAPGLFNTPLLGSAPEEVRKALGAQVPFPARLGNPEEYALLARQIVENDMLNGETIRLDGAIRMAPK